MCFVVTAPCSIIYVGILTIVDKEEHEHGPGNGRPVWHAKDFVRKESNNGNREPFSAIPDSWSLCQAWCRTVQATIRLL